jgi:hypothetical protein
MRRISTLFEIILTATLLVFGLYMLYEGSSNKSASAPAILIGGAACFTLGVMTLFLAVRSVLWHRHMLRHAMTKHDLNTSAPGHNPG